MAITQTRAKLKPTGARYISYRKKKKYEMGRLPTLTRIGAHKKRTKRVVGAKRKQKLISAEFANVLDPNTNKYSKSKIKTVIESQASKHYVRRNIIVKGSVIGTEAGKAKVTSRPGQDGVVNAVLVSE
ncbi:MAG: 30S ribosomal protein S8e [Candidatus Woesearchaeota archaeon]